MHVIIGPLKIRGFLLPLHAFFSRVPYHSGKRMSVIIGPDVNIG